jgi:hypothetical protein
LSQPGHFQEVTILGDIIRVFRHPTGMVRGVVVQVTLDERLELAILSNHWPPQPSSQHPLLWWGMKSTLFAKHLLDPHPKRHGG